MKKLMFIWCFFCVSKLLAQEEIAEPERRFQGIVTLGFNASQINGDRAVGYNKLGLYGGVMANVLLSAKRGISTGIIFSQRGSTAGLTGSNWAIKANMIEVPLIFNIKDWYNPDGFYRMSFGAGLNYSRLIGASAPNTPWAMHTDKFRTSNVDWLMEATIFKNKNFGLGVRYSRGLTRLYRWNTLGAPVAIFQEQWITFKSMYYF